MQDDPDDSPAAEPDDGPAGDSGCEQDVAGAGEPAADAAEEAAEHALEGVEDGDDGSDTEETRRSLYEALQASVDGNDDLADEEREQIRVLGERLRKMVEKTVEPQFKNIFNDGPLARIAKNMNAANRFTVPGAGKLIDTVKFLPAGPLAKAFPRLNVEPPWKKNLKFINSDVYKSAGLGQTHLTSLGARLVRNADFDFAFDKTAAKFASQFAAQQTSFLGKIGPLLATLNFRVYPANLRAIDGLKVVDLEAVVLLDGIALYAVPRTQIAEQLINAETIAQRRDILGRRWKAISADCREAVAQCTTGAYAVYVPFLVSALDALDADNPHAAQALAASVIDTVVTAYLGKRRYDYTPNKKATDTKAYDEFTLREFIAFGPLWQAYQQYWASNGDPIPRTFNRNASAHGVSTLQFSRRNAVQAVMFAAGLLVFLEEEAALLLK